MDLHQLGVQQHPELAEIDLSLVPSKMRLHHRDIDRPDPQIHLQPGNHRPHRRSRYHRVVFLNQTFPDPLRRVTLLTVNLLIGDQPATNDRFPRPRHRQVPHSRLPRRRDRILQRRPNRAPMHPMRIS